MSPQLGFHIFAWIVTAGAIFKPVWTRIFGSIG